MSKSVPNHRQPVDYRCLQEQGLVRVTSRLFEYVVDWSALVGPQIRRERAESILVGSGPLKPPNLV
jgi:hypothetical protein